MSKGYFMREMNEKKERNRTGNRMAGRQEFLDVLRVLATCAVVLLHTLTGAVDAVDINQYPLERMVFLVTMDLITWCVPIFVLISGYLFLNPARSFGFVQMLKKYCRRIVLALFLFGVPYAVLELMLAEHTFRLSMLGQGIFMVLQGESWSHMWYLYLILFLYLITPALKWALARTPKGCVYFLLIVLVVFCSVFPFMNKLLGLELSVLPDAGIYFFYYICGYLFACEKRCEKSCAQGECSAEQARKARMIGIVRGIAILAILVGMVLSRIGWNFSVQMAYNYPFTVLVSVLAFGAFKRGMLQMQKKHAVIWEKLGELSFAIYLVHPVFVNAIYKFLHISLLDFPIGLSLPVFFAVILVLATIAAWILCRIPMLKKYVL